MDVRGYGAGGRSARRRGRARIESSALIGDLAQSTAQPPIAEVDRLVRAIEAIDDEHARLEEEQGALRTHLDLLSRLGPAVPPIPQHVSHGTRSIPLAGRRPGLRPGATGLARGSRAVHRRSQPWAHAVSRQKLVEEVRKLSGGPVLPSPRRCYQVTATLSGQGLVDVWLTYDRRGAGSQPTT